MTTIRNRYLDWLPSSGYAETAPVPVRAPSLLLVNETLGAELGLPPDWLQGESAAQRWAGNQLPPDSRPIALAYAGHQFGQPVPQLGDGRAVIIGQALDTQGSTWDLQLKGAGTTPFSRMGDGRAGIGPVLREYIVSEAMHALGIPTTRSLAAVTTGERIARSFGPEAGAVLTRVASSHLRFGSFEYFAHRGDVDALQQLADTAISWHFPSLDAHPTPDRYLALLDALVDQTAALIVEWLRVGFIHGVMNTDNMALSGETLDYGPCAFMDAYEPGQFFSSVDRGGRYAFDQQARIGHWNLARLAECLLPLIDEDSDRAVSAAERVLDTYRQRFEDRYQAMLARKLGLSDVRDGDDVLVERLLGLMARQGADFTNTFRQLSTAPPDNQASADTLCALLGDTREAHDWVVAYQQRLRSEDAQMAGQSTASERQARMLTTNPAFIPRNHQLEAVLAAAASGDIAPAQRLLSVLMRPYETQPDAESFASPPRPEEQIAATFCGT
ncbi:MAG: YdiU family protein [Spiribacter sp.]|nr:YdiU family protein [Spiribacter sp.]